VNFRKDRVSKAAAFGSLVLALNLLAPTRPAPPAIPMGWATDRAPGSLAYAQPPRLANNCAAAQGKLRFAMITEEPRALPPPARNPLVCLAGHSPGHSAGD
jgi:hypothetical protein